MSYDIATKLFSIFISPNEKKIVSRFVVNSKEIILSSDIVVEEKKGDFMSENCKNLCT